MAQELTVNAEALAAEIGAMAPATLPEITASADVIITVVTDDAAQIGLFSTTVNSLLADPAGPLNFATRQSDGPAPCGSTGRF